MGCFRRSLVAVLVSLTAVGGIATAAPADSAPVPSNTVFTYHSLSIFGFDLSPDLVPSVDCVFHAAKSTTSTYWFGYSLTNDDPLHDLPVTQPIGPINMFEELDATGAVVDATANRGQDTQFQTGTHTYQFGVTVPTGNALRWTIAAPNPDIQTAHVLLGYWVAQITTIAPPACPPGFRAKSAAPQSPDFASINFAPTDQVVAKGLLKKGKVEFSLTGVTSACSAGGTPLPPKVLWGFSDYAVTPAINFAPVKNVERIDTFTAGDGAQSTFVRTWNGTRAIVDPQLPFTQIGGVSSHGLATTRLLADVYARCSFADESGDTTTVTSKSVLWSPENGAPRTFAFVTDQATQTTRLATCASADTCEYDPGSPGGGIKFR